MVNANDRREALAKLPKHKFSIKKVDLAYNYEGLKDNDGRRVDKVYEFEPISRSENPRKKLELYHNGANQHKKIVKRIC